MKYKLLKNKNESFRKILKEQEDKINNQTKLIDKLTSEKLSLLSKLETKRIQDDKK